MFDIRGAYSVAPQAYSPKFEGAGLHAVDATPGDHNNVRLQSNVRLQNEAEDWT